MSLRGLFDGEAPTTHSDVLSFAEVTKRLLRPGFPAWRGMTPEDSALLLRGYLAETVRTDLPRLSDVRGGPAVLDRLIAAVAASSASAVTNQALARDLAPVAPNLAVLASGFGGQVLHYRDSNNHELDAVVLHPDGRWAAVEVKLAGARIKDAARSLSRVVDQIDAEPAFRLVITGTGPTLTLHDGTITCGLHRLMP